MPETWFIIIGIRMVAQVSNTMVVACCSRQLRNAPWAEMQLVQQDERRNKQPFSLRIDRMGEVFFGDDRKLLTREDGEHTCVVGFFSNL